MFWIRSRVNGGFWIPYIQNDNNTLDLVDYRNFQIIIEPLDTSERHAPRSIQYLDIFLAVLEEMQRRMVSSDDSMEQIQEKNLFKLQRTFSNLLKVEWVLCKTRS